MQRSPLSTIVLIGCGSPRFHDAERVVADRADFEHDAALRAISAIPLADSTTRMPCPMRDTPNSSTVSRMLS